ncbi:MAG: Mur ligase family protein [Bacteroidota bacterium]
MSSYKEALEYLQSRLPMYHRIGPAAYKANLNNTYAICKMLGNPEKDFPAVHIAGTNGKGSVSHMLASVLQECGYKTGLFTSPHLKDFRERIRINGKMIPQKKVIAFLEENKKQIEKIEPSFFELTAGLAFEHFSENNVDIAIIETGLGGRLDSTNVVKTILSVITNIGNDHKNLLGESILQRATEKAGIIKTGTPVVIGETQKEIKQIFLDKAAECHTQCVFADKLFHSENINAGTTGGKPLLQTDVYKGKEMYFRKLRLALHGKYQLKNLMTVATALEELKKSGIKITKENIRKGISHVVENTGLRGRWEALSKSPLTICDVGHNEEGMQEVLAMIKMTSHKKLHAVLGLADDKDAEKILKMWPADAIYYFCKANIPRGMDAALLADKGNNAGLKGKAYKSVRAALKAARTAAMDGDLVFVGGSVFVVAEAIS